MENGKKTHPPLGRMDPESDSSSPEQRLVFRITIENKRNRSAMAFNPKFFCIFFYTW
jgi:hypothetical protein